MVQEDIERQLKIWKELAVSKQLLIRAATDALGLDPDCEAGVLKSRLNEAIKRSMEADANVDHAREQARIAVEVMKKKVADNDKAVENARKVEQAAQKKLEKLQQSMESVRSASLEEVKKAKAAVAEKDKNLKAINKALADTPENVIKKLNSLKKQKADATKAQKQAELATRATRKEKQQVQQRLSNVRNSAVTLTKQFRDLHQLCTDMRKQLKPLLSDGSSVPRVPKLDEKFLGSFKKEEGDS